MAFQTSTPYGPPKPTTLNTVKQPTYGVTLQPDFSSSPTYAQSAQIRPEYIPPNPFSISNNPIGSVAKAVMGAISNNGSTLGTQSTNQTNQTNQQQQAPPADSRVVELQKMANSGGLNPAQQTELNNLLSSQATAWAQDPANQINSAYGETDQLLNTMQDRLMGTQQDFYNMYSGLYDAQLPQLKTARDTSVQQLGQQQDQAKYNEANVINSARRLYDEMQRGYRQRFGGANSVSDFSSGILGRELMRNIGSAQNTTGQTIRALQDKAMEINRDYETKVETLNMQKNNALLQARNDFQDKLNQIEAMRLQNAQNKAQAKLSALQELRQRAYQIQDQATQYQQQLNAMRQQADLQLQTMRTQFAQNAGGTVVGQNPDINYSAQGAPAPAVPQQTIYGAVNPLGRKINDVIYGQSY